MYNYVVFVEKILRVQPNIKKLYLLIRASDSNSAMHRLHSEVLYLHVIYINVIKILTWSLVAFAKF